MTAEEICRTVVGLLNRHGTCDVWSCLCEECGKTGLFYAKVVLTHRAGIFPDETEELYSYGAGYGEDVAWRVCAGKWLERAAKDLRVPCSFKASSVEELELKLAVFGGEGRPA